jgi:hypothetical protein
MNIEAPKVSINRERFTKAIKEKGCTISKLSTMDTIQRDASTLRRYLRKGAVPEAMLERICVAIDVDPIYVSTEFDDRVERIEPDPQKRECILKKFTARDFPYSKKEKREIDDDKYWRNILLRHDIPDSLFQSLSSADQLRLLLELNRAIDRVLYQFFPPEVRSDDYRRIKSFEISTDEFGNEYVVNEDA